MPKSRYNSGMDKEAMRPVRKTEAGRYDGLNQTDLAGNDVDSAPSRKVDVFAQSPGSFANQLMKRRKKIEAMKDEE